MDYLRTFIAIELPEEIKQELGRLQSRLRLLDQPGISPVKPESSHLTLKFLGNTPADKIEAIQAAMLAATRDTPAFELGLKGVGCFPNASRPRVVWVGLAGEEELLLLQMALEDSVEKLGFPREAREFTAHLTLARVKDDCLPEVRRALGERVQATVYQHGLEFQVDHVNLMRSVLKPTGAVYSVLHRVELASR